MAKEGLMKNLWRRWIAFFFLLKYSCPAFCSDWEEYTKRALLETAPIKQGRVLLETKVKNSEIGQALLPHLIYLRPLLTGKLEIDLAGLELKWDYINQQGRVEFVKRF